MFLVRNEAAVILCIFCYFLRALVYDLLCRKGFTFFMLEGVVVSEIGKNLPLEGLTPLSKRSPIV